MPQHWVHHALLTRRVTFQQKQACWVSGRLDFIASSYEYSHISNDLVAVITRTHITILMRSNQWLHEEHAQTKNRKMARLHMHSIANACCCACVTNSWTFWSLCGTTAFKGDALTLRETASYATAAWNWMRLPKMCYWVWIRVHDYVCISSFNTFVCNPKPIQQTPILARDNPEPNALTLPTSIQSRSKAVPINWDKRCQACSAWTCMNTKTSGLHTSATVPAAATVQLLLCKTVQEKRVGTNHIETLLKHINYLNTAKNCAFSFNGSLWHQVRGGTTTIFATQETIMHQQHINRQLPIPLMIGYHSLRVWPDMLKHMAKGLFLRPLGD